MLYPNGQRVLCYPGRHMAGALAACGALNYGGLRGDRINRFASDSYSGVAGAIPSGYGQGAWLMAVKAGGIAGFSDIAISQSGSGTLGMPGSGSSSFTFAIADADGQLISSGSGSASLSVALADALLIASVGGTGSALISLSIPLTTLGALADTQGSASVTIVATPATAYPIDSSPRNPSGSASVQVSGQLQPYAVGQMSGSTQNTSVLTADSIASAVWSAVAAQYPDGATMGGKLNTASAGGVDLSSLANAVISALQATAIPVNVEKMNGADVIGDGSVSNPWRGVDVQP